MNSFYEVKEFDSKGMKDFIGEIKAFENIKNDMESEKKTVKHITTINETLEGKTYQEVDVEYKKHIFRLDGEKVEGVFPVFESRFDVVLPKELRTASDTEQFKYCTKKLQYAIEHDSDLAAQFTPRQLEQIQAKAPRISGLTWHHNEIPGKMQLVNAETHAICRHTGGRSIWGGGSEYR